MFYGLYSGKRILITGNTGFKGSWLSYWLLQLGAEVHGYSKDIPSDPNHYELLSLKVNTLFEDVLDFTALNSAIEELQPDIIFHLAAQPLVRTSYESPLLTFKTNIIGTANVLEAVRNTKGVRALVNITTDKVYENKEREEPYKEDDALGGYDPYSASKAGSEIVTASYRQAFNNPKSYGLDHETLIATARSGNVIGGGDWAVDRLIPDIVKAASKNELVSIRNPQATRPWQHVLEPLSGYLLLGAELLNGNTKAASSWNFGPSNEETSVKKVLLDCKKQWPQIYYEIDEDKHHHEAQRLQLDSSKAMKKLQWNNVWSYDDSISKTIDWYRQYYEHKTVITDKQLAEYVESAQKKELSWTL